MQGRLRLTAFCTLQAFIATAYVFCAILQSIPPAGRHSIVYAQYLVVQDTRPTDANWPAIASEGNHIYAEIAIRSPP